MRAFVRNRGFTLIEMMVAVAIIGIAASVVVMTLPSTSAQQQGRALLARLADAIPAQRLEAMARGELIGLMIQGHGYQFMVQDTQAPTGWKTLTSAQATFAESVTFQLMQQDLLLDEAPPGESSNKPQLLLFPGGEVTPFELNTFIGRQPGGMLRVTEAGEVTMLEPAGAKP